MIDGITYIQEDDEPELMFTLDGGVLLGVTVSSAIRFRTLEAYDRWQERVDRQRASHNLASVSRDEPVLPLAEAG